LTPIPEQNFERWIGNLLRTGLALAVVVVLAGGVAFLLKHGHAPTDYRTFQRQPAIYRTPQGIVKAAVHGDAVAVIQLGLLLLIATPIARVALSLGFFARAGDRLYVVVTLIVLLVLLGSVAAGH
jgi:uncharacterized membrane protein